MKCFPLLATVLDEVWEELPGDEAAKLKAVNARGDYLQDRYRQLTTTSGVVDYADPATRYIYLCRYVASHANMVAQLISTMTELRALFDRDRVQITCVGGGPGSDLLGVLKHMDDSGQRAALKFFLFDREQAWSESWSDVDDKLGRGISAFFQQFDVTEEKTWSQATKYLNADLFTMVYFASEVHHLRDEAAPFFKHMFERSKEGSIFLYIDNASPVFWGWFDKQIPPNQLEVLASADSVTLRMPGDEQKDELGVHYERMAGFPKLSGNVAYRLLRKGL